MSFVVRAERIRSSIAYPPFRIHGYVPFGPFGNNLARKRSKATCLRRRCKSVRSTCARVCSLVSRAVRNAPAVLYCFTSSISGVVRQALEMSLAVSCPPLLSRTVHDRARRTLISKVAWGASLLVCYRTGACSRSRRKSELGPRTQNELKRKKLASTPGLLVLFCRAQFFAKHLSCPVRNRLRGFAQFAVDEVRHYAEAAAMRCVVVHQ